MSSAWVVVIGSVIALFWGLGAYNRLTRLRADACRLLDHLLESWLVQASLLIDRLAPYEPQSGQSAWAPVHDETVQWRALAASAKQLAACCNTAKSHHGRLPEHDILASVWQARSVFEAHWQRLKDAHADLAGAAIPADLQALWSQHELLARDRFNASTQALADYTQAIDQFPASVLARLFKFERTAAPVSR